VGEVEIRGAVDRAVQISIDAQRLAAYRLSIAQVHDAIVAQNAEIPGGRVDAGFRELSLRTLGRLPHARDFEDLVVTTVDGVPVRVGDLGEARDSEKERRAARPGSRDASAGCEGGRAAGPIALHSRCAP
jgi:HAE1 family hydrophobic/amphiphilic exporter-1